MFITELLLASPVRHMDPHITDRVTINLAKYSGIPNWQPTYLNVVP